MNNFIYNLFGWILSKCPPQGKSAGHYTNFKYCYTPTLRSTFSPKSEGKEHDQTVDTTDFLDMLVENNPFKRSLLPKYLTGIPSKNIIWALGLSKNTKRLYEAM